MRYHANAKVLDGRGKEIGRVTFHVKAKNRSEAKRKIGRLMKARKPKPKVKKNRKRKNSRRKRR